MTDLYPSDLGSKQQTHDPKHKEEGTGRIKSDADDRSKIRSVLNKCIHPLLVETHASNVLVNIYTGEESTKSVNVNKAAEIGKNQIDEFQDNLPDAFRKTLTTKVFLMTSLKDKKTIQKAEKGDYNEDLIFSRVLLLLGSNQIDFKDVFNFELAAVPRSLFYETGNARYAKNKSVLMNKLKVEESSRGIQFDSVIIDGGGLMHEVYWPTDGMVKYLVDGVEKYIKMFIFDSDVFLIFDRYKADSIKSDTRSARIGSFQRSYQLSLDRELPPMCLCLSSTSTKENLIEIISGELFE